MSVYGGVNSVTCNIEKNVFFFCFVFIFFTVFSFVALEIPLYMKTKHRHLISLVFFFFFFFWFVLKTSFSPDLFGTNCIVSVVCQISTTYYGLGGKINLKKGCLKDCTQIGFTFLLEIFASFKECLHDYVRRIPIFQSSIIRKLYQFWNTLHSVCSR